MRDRLAANKKAQISGTREIFVIIFSFKRILNLQLSFYIMIMKSVVFFCLHLKKYDMDNKRLKKREKNFWKSGNYEYLNVIYIFKVILHSNASPDSQQRDPWNLYLINNEEDIVVFLGCSILINSVFFPTMKCASHLCREITIVNDQFS